MELAERMKKYERTTEEALVHRMPAILRVDGRAFHTFTKGFDKPFDKILMKCMEAAALALCEDISSAKIAYGQSDEISVLLVDYDNFNTMQWFDGNVAKICSIAASAATNAFNKCLDKFSNEFAAKSFLGSRDNEEDPDNEMAGFLSGKMFKAMFDARVFSIPKEDVMNYFLWRRQDAVRNSVASVAQANFSAKTLHGVNIFGMKKMLLEKGIDWDTMPCREKEGFYYIKEKFMDGEVERSRWTLLEKSPTPSWAKSYLHKTIDLQLEKV